MRVKRFDPRLAERVRRWVKNSAAPDAYSRIDWDTEIDSALSFNENINLLLEKFPEAWRETSVKEYYLHIKQIIFVTPLIEKMLRGEIQCTYRTTPKHGYYYVLHSRFTKTHLKNPVCIIEVYKTEPVDPRLLTDQEARYAGVDTGEDIRALFRRWYGELLPNPMWRNWFHLKENPQR